MKVLITGAKGQLGTELRRCLETGRAEIGPIPAAYEGAEVQAVDYDSLDISDGAAVEAWFAGHGPYDIVFNCAAITNVDGCEADEAGAYAVNAEGAAHVARAADACGAKLVHVSTDYVFPGTEERPRTEEDPTGPISAYGRTKLAGEQAARAACPRTFVVRTAWLYGYAGGNFAKTMMRLARQNGAIAVVADQVGNPTSANDLAHEMLKLACTDGYGVYHCTNDGSCSWYDFACAVVDLAGIPCRKEPLTSRQYKERFPQSADRPAFSSLDNRHLRRTVGDEMRPWREALQTYMDNLGGLESQHG